MTAPSSGRRKTRGRGLPAAAGRHRAKLDMAEPERSAPSAHSAFYRASRQPNRVVKQPGNGYRPDRRAGFDQSSDVALPQRHGALLLVAGSAPDQLQAARSPHLRQQQPLPDCQQRITHQRNRLRTTIQRKTTPYAGLTGQEGLIQH